MAVGRGAGVDGAAQRQMLADARGVRSITSSMAASITLASTAPVPWRSA
jgi:hypothetical protein